MQIGSIEVKLRGKIVEKNFERWVIRRKETLNGSELMNRWFRGGNVDGGDLTDIMILSGQCRWHWY